LRGLATNIICSSGARRLEIRLWSVHAVFGSPHWTISATGCGWACRPAKGNENRGIGQNVGAESGEIEISHGAIEAEQLFDPERA